MNEKRIFNGNLDEDGNEVDPSMTIEVRNDEFEEMVKAYQKEQNGENLMKLTMMIQKCRFLVPAAMREEGQPIPMLIRTKDEHTFLPIYTSKENLPQEKTPAMMNLPYEVVARTVLNSQDQIEGIVINPFTMNLVFQRSIIEKIEARNAQPKIKPVQLSTEQYNIVMRKQFEFGFLPKEYFTKRQEFITSLVEQKEEYIDQLYEASYQNPRLYPYLTEEFSVMAMDISDDLIVIRVDMPERNVVIPTCYRVYFTWDKKEQKGRYFTIERTSDAEVKLLGEMTENLQHVTIGNAPVEGAELQEIIDLHNGTSKMTS